MQVKVRVSVDTTSSDHLVLRECEEWRGEWSDGRWYHLPDMGASRCCSNPCEYNGLLWIFGDGSKRMEAFDYRSRTFRKDLQVEETYSSPCVLFVENEELVILSRTFVTRWTWTNESLKEHSRAKHQHCYVDSNSSPMVDFVNRLVVISQDGNCSWVSFEGDTRVEFSR